MSVFRLVERDQCWSDRDRCARGWNLFSHFDMFPRSSLTSLVLFGLVGEEVRPSER